ncbi:MAG: hypothetical protein R2724_00580 [Bryobacterales bacterium]
MRDRHLDDFNATTDPDHAAAGFPQTLRVLPYDSAVDRPVFDHNTTNFPLTGAHTSVAQSNLPLGRTVRGPRHGVRDLPP